jgi:hypothetical protein
VTDEPGPHSCRDPQHPADTTASPACETGEPDFRHAAEIQKLIDLCFVSDAEGRIQTVP